MAEIEIGVFEHGCLSRRVAHHDELRTRIATVEAERNAHHATINWQFTTADARLKFQRFYATLLETDAL